MKTISIFDSGHQFSISFKEIVLNPDIWGQYKTFTNYCDQNSLSIVKDDLLNMIQKIEKTLFQQIQYFCYFQYYLMSTLQEWGDPGRQQVESSFCRILFDVPVDQYVSGYYFDQLSAHISKMTTQLGFDKKEPQKLKEDYKAYTFTILDKTFSFLDIEQLCRFMQFIGSEWVIQGGIYGEERELILGKGATQTIGDYTLIKLEKEIMRTPNAIIPMAAVIGEQQIFVRKESLSVIFYQKWEPVFSISDQYRNQFFQKQSIFDVKKALENGYYSIDTIDQTICHFVSYLIKNKALNLYHCFSADSLSLIRSDFVEDMAETILHHECGHGIIQMDVLPVETATLAESTKLLGETIITAFLEYLADFAPKKETLIGSFQNMVDVYHIEPERAARMFYMYLSDVWFYDTDDTYMLTYSDLMVLSMIYFLDDNGQIKFDRLERVLSESLCRSQTNIISFSILSCEHIVDTLKQYLQSISYSYEHKIYSFDALAAIFKDQIYAEDATISEYRYFVSLWTRFLECVLAQPKDHQYIMRLLADFQVNVISELWELTTNKQTLNNYNNNHRDYIFDQLYQKLGV